MKCLNINNLQVKELVDKYGEVYTSKILDLYEEKVGGVMLPTLQEFKEFIQEIEPTKKFDNDNKLIYSFDNQTPQITKDDKIIWGHPGLGKTYLRDTNPNIIDFDSDYKWRINEDFNLEKGFEARKKWRKENEELWNQKMREYWEDAKHDAKHTGKKLFVSDMIFLREYVNDFDKIITMTPELFIQRAKQRNDFDEGTISWKANIDKAISNVSDKSKIITTDKYLSDLLPNENKLNYPNLTPQWRKVRETLDNYLFDYHIKPGVIPEDFKQALLELDDIDGEMLVRYIEGVERDFDENNLWAVIASPRIVNEDAYNIAKEIIIGNVGYNPNDNIDKIINNLIEKIQQLEKNQYDIDNDNYSNDSNYYSNFTGRFSYLIADLQRFLDSDDKFISELNEEPVIILNYFSGINFDGNYIDITEEQYEEAKLNKLQPIEPYSESRFNTNPIEVTTTFKNTIEQLSNRLGIPVFYNTTLKVGGMFKDGRIYLNPDKITPETHWHEFSHPFIQSIQKFKPELYNSLVAEINSTKYGQSLREEVSRLYSDKSKAIQDEEVIVELIARFASGRLVKKDVQANPNLWNKLIEFLKEIGRMIFGLKASKLAKSMNPAAEVSSNPIMISELGNDLTIKDLANILKYGGLIKLNNETDIEIDNKLVQRNKFTAKDLNGVYHNLGAYMNNTEITDLNTSIAKFITILSNPTIKRFELAGYSGRGNEFLNIGQVRIQFKNDSPIKYAYTQDVGSQLVKNRADEIERVANEESNDYIRNTKYDDTYNYDEVFINASKDNIYRIILNESTIFEEGQEELNAYEVYENNKYSLNKLSDLTGADIITDSGDVLYKPQFTRDYNSIEYESRFTQLESNIKSPLSNKQYLDSITELDRLNNKEILGTPTHIEYKPINIPNPNIYLDNYLQQQGINTISEAIQTGYKQYITLPSNYNINDVIQITLDNKDIVIKITSEPTPLLLLSKQEWSMNEGMDSVMYDYSKGNQYKIQYLYELSNGNKINYNYTNLTKEAKLALLQGNFDNNGKC